MASFALPTNKRLKREIFSYAGVLLGSLLVAAAYVFFNTPYKVTPGGVYGLGIVINHFFPNLMVGTIGLCLDIPLLITFFLVFGKGAGFKTVFSAFSLPLLMNGLTTLVGGEDPAIILGGNMNLSDDILLASIYGGVITGIGLGIIIKSGATSGGTDVISMLITKFFKLPFSKSTFIVESMVILTGMLVFGDWKLPLYSLISLFLTSKLIDMILEGAGTDKMMLIVSDKHEEIRKFILEDLGRGGTYFKGMGMYSKEDKPVIFVVVSRSQLVLMKDFVCDIDEFAFITVVAAHETMGDGFKKLKKEN